MPHAPIECPPTGNYDFDNADWSKIPHHVREGLHEYIRTGRPVGGFLTAVLSNDLFQAVVRADPGSMGGLKAVIHFLQFMPVGCYGTPAKVAAWMAGRGLVGDDSRITVGSIAELKAADPSSTEVFLSAADQSGIFRWTPGDFTRNVADATDDGVYVKAESERAEPAVTQIIMIHTIKDGDDNG